MEAKHTERAGRAAEKVLTLIEEDSFLKAGISGGSGIVFDRPVAIERVTAIIDRETGLPDLQSRIDRLEAEKVETQKALKITIAKLCDTVLKRGEDEERIARLEAEKAELVEVVTKIREQASKAVVVVSGMYGVDADNICAIVMYIRNKARAALAKVEPTNPEARGSTYIVSPTPKQLNRNRKTPPATADGVE